MVETRASKKRKTERQCSVLPSTTPWSDLPLEIIENIMRFLSHIDQIRLRAVCKEWSSIHGAPPLKQWPWLMAFTKYNLWRSWKLFDPVSKKSFAISVDDERLYEEDSFNVQVHTCKRGWFLLSNRKNPHSLFLFSPFSNGRFIDLPSLSTAVDIATFSTTPTDLDCVFFALSGSRDTATTSVAISTCSPNHKTWTTRTFLCNPMKYTFYMAEYLEGTFYCMSSTGTIGAYNTAKQNWRVSNKHIFDIRCNVPKLVVSDGEIFAVNVSDHGNNCLWGIQERCYFEVDMYKLDVLKMSWRKVDSLGGRAMFYDCHCRVHLLATLAERKSVNGLFCPVRGRCYSKQFRISGSSRKRRIHECSKHYGSLAKENMRMILIECPW